MAHWDKAITGHRDSVDILNNLGWILSTFPDASLRDGHKAVALAERANQLSGAQNPSILRTLAAAYAEAGNFDNAIRTAGGGMEIATAQNNSELSDVLANDIRHYRQREPLRTAAQPESSRSP